MTDEGFEHELGNLRKLHVDLEKQMLNFDEIVPYERQRTADIYSPRLLNMMLVCGSQIEAVTKLTCGRCKIRHDDGIRPAIRKLDKDGVLSGFRIFSIPHRLQFSPFTKDLEWWEAYNGLKHDLQDKQFKITYTAVMDAFAVLAALHRLADKLAESDNEQIQQVLDKNSWKSNEILEKYHESNKETNHISIFWRSLLFEIKNSYFRDPLFFPYAQGP
ncbi:MAG: hypothetical protein KGI33_01215 [Thaumarchaeota archaeon]|nr:hypothetical protein [Nitrososphaerota archaeon]